MGFTIDIKPWITEKSVKLAEKGKYTFLVDKKAKKMTIRQVLKDLYGVIVGNVNVCVVKSKRVRVPKYWKYKRLGFKKGYKKVIVTIKEGGDKIANLFKI
uniref:Large ribosomal subunit protein uL23 n=1 Tax=candidate division CPR3 bacterium TaxID=2268181 RepID=A0A7C5UVY1_UNCC3